MTVGRRLRLSLLSRMAVALAVLGFVALVVVGVLAGMGALVGVVLTVVAGPVVGVLDAAPLLSSRIPVGPTTVVAAALVGLTAAAYGVPTVARVVPRLSEEDVERYVSLWELTCLYLLTVEGLAAARVHAPDDPDLLYFTAVFALILVWGAVVEVREEVRAFRTALLDDTVPAEDDYPAVRETTRRLAQQADLPAPAVRVAETDRPESFTLGTGSDAVVVISTGLVGTLSWEQLEAVIAHEVSHLANADGAVMSAALVPVLLAADLVEPDSDSVVWNATFTALKWYGQFGVAVLSVGREWAADDAAAALTGSPAALAAALERIHDDRARPSRDLREWEQTVAALDVLPPDADAAGTGPFDTHPPTEKRIARLRKLAARTERT